MMGVGVLSVWLPSGPLPFFWGLKHFTVTSTQIDWGEIIAGKMFFFFPLPNFLSVWVEWCHHWGMAAEVGRGTLLGVEGDVIVVIWAVLLGWAVSRRPTASTSLLTDGVYIEMHSNVELGYFLMNNQLALINEKKKNPGYSFATL